MRVSPGLVAATAIVPPGSTTPEAFAACVGTMGAAVAGAGRGVAISRDGSDTAAVGCGCLVGEGFVAGLASRVGEAGRTAAGDGGAVGIVVGVASAGVAATS